MNQSIAHTPLECLLLFQSLVTFGHEEQEFVRISDLITNNPLVENGETYDAKRLAPECLRSVYLKLIRDELRVDGLGGVEQAGNLSPKKRKASRPTSPFLEDASTDKVKLPALVDKLYARYKEHMVQAIEADERQYALLQREIQEIERGQWDDRILKDTQPPIPNGITTVSKSPMQEVPSQSTQPVLSTRFTEPVGPTIPGPVTSPSRPDGLAISDVLNSQEVPPAVASRPPESRPVHNLPPVVHQRTGSSGLNGPSLFQPPPGAYHPNGALRWETPYGPSHQPPPYQPGSYNTQFNGPQYPPHQVYPQLRPGSFSSPHPLPLPPPHQHVPSSPINSQHPVILPPPNPSRSPSTPGLPMNQMVDITGQLQQYRQTSSSPLLQQGPMTYQQPYPPQPRSMSGSGPPPLQQQQWNQSQPFAPYPSAPPIQYAPNQRQAYTPQQLQQTENRAYTSPYNANQGPRPVHPGIARGRPSLPSTPTQRTHLTQITGSGTKWTTQIKGTSTPNSSYVHIKRPDVEPISPILQPAVLQKSEVLQSGDQTPRPKQKATRRKASPEPPTRRTHRTRAGSTASSAIAGSHRSQSVMSHADEMSVDSRVVKEEVATPLAADDAGDTTADDRPAMKPRSRAGLKRKRQSSVEPRPTQALPSHVLWTRAFAKISVSALETITSHKNASTFAAPVKDRDAPGYKNLILRPQDLKSIRSAILAGQRAAAAAAPADITASSVWLPISEDLIPPKGIINYAQLDKELMRMFANAIMFNADPDRGLGRRWRIAGNGNGGEDSLGYEIDEDGVVKDTKHMFADTEKIIAGLRSAERRSEEAIGIGAPTSVGVGNGGREGSFAIASAKADDEEDEVTRDSESHSSVVKRRRKA